MIEINLDPNLLFLGPFLITWHGLFTAVGVLVGVWVAARLSPRVGVDPDNTYNLAFWCVAGGIVGARLLFVAENLDHFAANPISILFINEGGISIYGAVLGGTLAGVLAARLGRLPVGRLADVAAPGLILGMGIGRIGDIINGEHHGLPTDLAIGVIYTHARTLGPPASAGPTHLAVGYELVLDLLIFGFLFWLIGRRPRPGTVYLAFLGLYSLARFLVSYLRVDQLILWDLRMAQLVAIVSLVFAAALLVLRYRGPAPAPVQPFAPARPTRADRRRR